MFNLFKLPPVSERHMNQAFLRLLKPTTTWRVDQDDNYIYYLLLRNDITFASVFCNSTSISGHSIHLYYMTISIDPADKARSVAYAFSWKVAPLMLALFMPYAWLLFRANIDIREFDLLKRVPKFATRMEGKRSKIIKWSLIIVAVFLADMFFAAAGIAWIFDHHLATPDSTPVLLLSLLFLPFLFGGSMFAIPLGVAMAYQHWRRLGPYYNSNI